MRKPKSPKEKYPNQKRYIREYAKVISEQSGVPVDIVHDLITAYWKAVVLVIMRGDDVRIKGFGRIYWNKKPPLNKHLNGTDTEPRGTR